MPALTPALDFRALFDAAPCPYLVLAPNPPEFTILDVNEAYLRATMTTREALVGSALFAAFPDNPDDPSADGVHNLRTSLEAALRTREPDIMAVQKYDIRRPAAEGGGFEERHWSSVNTPVLDANGSVTALIHHVEDVTAFVQLTHERSDARRTAAELRSQAERAELELYTRAQDLAEANRQLRAANAVAHAARAAAEEASRRLQTVLDVLPIGVGIADAQGAGVLVNPAYTELWGGPVPMPEVIEVFRGFRGWWPATGELIQPEEWATARALQTGEVVRDEEAEIETFDGQRKVVLTHAAPIRDASGVITGAAVAQQDITARKQAEDVLRASEEQLAAELVDMQRLQAISGQLISEGNLDGLYEQILAAAIAVMRSDMGSMQMFVPDRNALRLLAWRGFDPAAAAFWEWVRVDSGSSCGAALGAGTRVVVPDVEACDFMVGTQDLEFSRLSGIRAVQSTPLVSRDGQLVGMISTHWRTPHQPGEREMRLLDVLARQAADIIERRQLERRTHEALEALLAMAEVLMIAPAAKEQAEEQAEEMARGAAAPASGPHFSDAVPGRTPTPVSATAQATIARLTALTQRVLHGQYTATVILDRDGDAVHPLAVVGLTPEIERHWWRDLPRTALSAYLPTPLTERLVAEEVVVLDLAGQPPIPGQDYWDIQKVLAVPVRLDASRLVVLGAETRDRPAFTPQEVELARAATRLVALVIEREGLERERAAADTRELAASETNQQMRTFVGIAGHELRTPITTLRTNVQLAERALRASLTADLPQGATTKLQRAHGLLEGAERQIIRLNRLIEDMLDMTRIAAGKLDLRLSLDDLGDVVGEAVEVQRLAWPSRTIELEITQAQLTLSMDADRVGQVVTNYLTNALKYSAEGTSVAVAVTAEGGVARVAVRDHGPGLSPNALQHLWEPFQQVEEIRQQSGSGVGLGLGLHISKTIIERHGGTVGIDSVLCQGSTFWFTLPLSAADERMGT